MSKHVDTLNEEDKKKWLRQRNWEQEDDGLWRDPESGIRYGFLVALKRAKDDCRVPNDFELKPEVRPTPR